MIVQFFESDIHAGCEQVVKDVFRKTLGLRLFHKENRIVNAARNHSVDNGLVGLHSCLEGECYMGYERAESAHIRHRVSFVRTTQRWPLYA